MECCSFSRSRQTPTAEPPRLLPVKCAQELLRCALSARLPDAFLELLEHAAAKSVCLAPAHAAQLAAVALRQHGPGYERLVRRLLQAGADPSSVVHGQVGVQGALWVTVGGVGGARGAYRCLLATAAAALRGECTNGTQVCWAALQP